METCCDLSTCFHALVSGTAVVVATVGTDEKDRSACPFRRTEILGWVQEEEGLADVATEPVRGFGTSCLCTASGRVQT